MKMHSLTSGRILALLATLSLLGGTSGCVYSSTTRTITIAKESPKPSSESSSSEPSTEILPVNEPVAEPEAQPEAKPVETPADQIVFSSSRALDGGDGINGNYVENTWIMNADGTERRALTKATADRAYSRSPQWSPDRTKIVFSSAMKIDGSDAANAGFKDKPTSNIWIVNADGTGLKPLTKVTAADASSYEPQWSPDGMKILFGSRRKLDGSDAANTNPNGPATANLWVMNADGTGLTPLTDATAVYADSHSAQWSPDGGKIAFASTRNIDGTDSAGIHNSRNVWTVNADGTDPKPVTKMTDLHAYCDDPQWSPDGSKILFDSERELDGSDTDGDSSNIWVINADGTGLKPLTTTTSIKAASFMAQWSPDGSRIVFDSIRSLDGSDTGNTNQARNIWIMNADGTGLTPLTHATTLDENSWGVQWSTDGAHIAFTSNLALDGSDAILVDAEGTTTENIWSVNPDGSELKPLTQDTTAGLESETPEWAR